MKQIELYDQRFDWLVVSLLSVPFIWLFYGFDAAFINFLLYTLIGGLKPLTHRLGSRLVSGIFASGVILLLSPLLRIIFYNGYCYEGVWSVAADISQYLSPNVCDQGLFAHLDQGVWMGPLRDLAMPVAGIGLILIALPKSLKSEGPNKSEEGFDEVKYSQLWMQERFRWGILAFSVLLLVGGSIFNYRAEMAAQEAQRQAQVFESMLEATAAEEARRLAAEDRRIVAEAKNVDRKWLLGAWAPVEGFYAEDANNSEFYCGTDVGIIFKADGRYEEFDEEGAFTLINNEIKFSKRLQSNSDEADVPTQEFGPSTVNVERKGKQLIIGGTTYGRC